ncbi:hypothetical protein AB0911_08120 [Streptomyces nigra]|uniref:hypothetical protein n=1 Tax=Streptomyces nigra TaxID=1827580 RepID=UPI003456AD84
MTETIATGHLDTDGNAFEDKALYVDSYGDTWQYLGGIEEFMHVKRGDEDVPQNGPGIHRHCEDAVAVARGFGPMARTEGGRPCAECPETAPAGRAFCSTRCRNAADRHDEMDGDL